MSTTQMTSGDFEQLSERDVRALKEPLRVVEDDPDAWGDHEVAVYSEGRQYLVNIAIGFCECGDAAHRDVECKHSRRAKFALGIYEIPGWVEMDSVDDQLRQRLEDDSA